MKNKQKINSLMIFILILTFTSQVAVAMPGDLPGIPNLDEIIPVNVIGMNVTNNISANAPVAFEFQNNLLVGISTDTNLNLDLFVDTDNVRDHNFSLALSAPNGLELNIQISGNYTDFNLNLDGVVQVDGNGTYVYKEDFIIELDLDNEEQMSADLAINTEDTNAVWAYFDEVALKWIPVQSQYENGMLIARTDHFSTWTVLSQEAELNIPGYASLGSILIIGLVGLFIITKKTINQ